VRPRRQRRPLKKFTRAEFISSGSRRGDGAGDLAVALAAGGGQFQPSGHVAHQLQLHQLLDIARRQHRARRQVGADTAKVRASLGLSEARIPRSMRLSCRKS
jgi:hypothetical protein